MTDRVPWRDVIVFYLLACGVAWAIDLPLWLTGQGLSMPGAIPLIAASMYSPAIAAFVVTIVVQRTPWRQAFRRLGWAPIRPVRRTVRMAVIGLVGGVVLPIAVVFLAAAFGFIPLDLVNFSGFAAALSASLPTGTTLPMPIQLLVVIEIVQIPIGAVINGLFTLGEETGWRGFLLPALRPLGTWPALLISGALWGLWHTPIILLGYDFNRPNLVGVALMIVGCVALGVLVGWLRIRSGTIWPSVFAHGAFNAAGGFAALVVAAGATPDFAVVGPLGWIAWILMGIVAVVLALTRQVPPAREWATTADAG